MSALEMVGNVARRRQEAGEFCAWLADNGSPPTLQDEIKLTSGASLPIYGPVIGTNLEHFRTNEVQPAIALEAARLLFRATSNSERNYFSTPDTDEYRRNIDAEEFREALHATQTAMASGGEFVFMPAYYAMTAVEGIKQVTLADRLLGQASSEAQQLLAEANYTSYFGKQTMADAEDMLSTTVEATLDATSPDKMPHLKRTNLALAQLTANVARNMEKGARLVVLDCGTGSGGTLVPVITELNQVTDYHNVSLFGVEPNPGYAAGLRDFAPTFMEKIQEINPGFELVTSDVGVEIDRTETLSLVETDIVSMIDNLDIASLGGKDVVVLLQNYVWHRLPQNVKVGVIGRLIKKVADVQEAKGEAPSIILGVGDLEKNGSTPINDRYFNFGNNGPLNAGNLGLKGMFDFHGMRVVKLGTKGHRTPQSIHPLLAQAIINERANDGHMWIAYHGKEAERLIKAA